MYNIHDINSVMKKHMHICIYSHIHIHIYIYSHIHIHKHIDIGKQIFMLISTQKSIYISAMYTCCICMYICMCVCICVCMYVCRYMYVYIQPNLQNDVLKLIPSHPRPATFYTIPKVHKLPNLVVSTCPSSNLDNFIIEAQRLNINPLGRPIVSGIDTLTEYVSAFVDRELQPLLANIPSYIKDTTDFLNKLSRFDNLPDNTILVTLDVTALYSSIPHNDGIGACKKHLDRRALSTTSSEDICQLIKFILENNVFSFNDEYFLQVCGTAMGTRMAPCYTNIFMAELEENFLSGYPYKPFAYY